MFESVLIANRGEIAVRIMRTARRMGLTTIAVYSDADRHAMHVHEADLAVRIGPPPASESYLAIPKIIAAARETGAACIHPGYGFLSENADFAEACAAAGIVFVGPPPAAIRAMGGKAEAKTIMERAGVPVVPGYHGSMQDPKFLKQKAYETGYPVLIKAVAGGGGKGMRRVDKVVDFDEQLAAAQREAQAAFGNPLVLIEKFVTNPRHVEIQVFGDSHGRVVSLNERDCSIQRRHQKVLEEAPAPGMTAEVRAAMGSAAVKAAEAAGYVGAGTVEFIADGSAGLRLDGFWFMEMNTRLQVEHPVTECVTGFDLVEWQLRVAAGEPLPLAGDVPEPRGHAVEVRLYAEDPDHGFLPSAGRLDVLRLPEGDGIRVDTGVAEGDEVSAFYDPMIAKIIAAGPDRDTAFSRLRGALAGTVIAGPRSNLAFLRELAASETVLAGRHDTGFVDAHLAGLTGGTVSREAIAAATRLLVAGDGGAPASSSGWIDPFDVRDGFRAAGEARQDIEVAVDGVPRTMTLVWTANGPVIADDGSGGGAGGSDGGVGGGSAAAGRRPASEAASVAGGSGAMRAPADRAAADYQAIRTPASVVYAISGGRAVRLERVDELARRPDEDAAAGAATAPMHGKIVALHVAPGDRVIRGDRLFAVEAMKMEHTVTAPTAGTVASVAAAVGDQVAQGARVVVIEPLAAEAPE